uniref:SDR family NAD(P)-dependent oxidoreductase n=1 Tax=Phenylobacterium glaciei TaxID=2803784 RepID=A0A974S815_9CAUL|nr:SDR family NAD(P)-dependent oxidoreductase [Phenylobacterium glaciei]
MEHPRQKDLAARAARARKVATNQNGRRRWICNSRARRRWSPARRGIGRAIADLFAEEGANVAICARNADQVAETVAALKAKGVNAWGDVVDIADGPALKAFVTKAGETLGGIDILVSNASALVQAPARPTGRRCSTST